MILVLEAMILRANEIQQLPFLSNFMRHLCQAQEEGGEYFLKSIPESQFTDLFDIVEFPTRENMKKMAIAAASFGTYARINPEDSAELAEGLKERIYDLIKQYPSQIID